MPASIYLFNGKTIVYLLNLQTNISRENHKFYWLFANGWKFLWLRTLNVQQPKLVWRFHWKSDWCIKKMADFPSSKWILESVFLAQPIQWIIPMLNFCDRHLSIIMCCFFLYNFSQESRFSFFFFTAETNKQSKCFDTKASSFTNSNSVHTNVILQKINSDRNAKVIKL